jgi:hypothetical protein
MLAYVGLIAACQPDRATVPQTRTGPRYSAASILGAHWARPDDVLSAIGDQLPGFGGLYEDSTGIVVFLTDPPSQQLRAEQAIRPILAQSDGSGHFLLARLANAPIRFRQGQHTFAELQQWKRALYGHQIPTGTVEVGIDKRTNRLLVGVSRKEAATAWGHLVSIERVPNTAIHIEEMETPVPNVTVQSQVRPTSGGTQIIESGPNRNRTCTLGANVTLPYASPGDLFFLTASHCSDVMWGSDGPGTWYQSLITTGHDIATVEAMDPVPVTNGGSPYPGGFSISCPSGKLCRWSDATLVRYSDPSLGSLGKVAVATSVLYPNVATILSFKQYGTPRCFYCPAGPIYKTGRTTGTTQGSGNTVDVDFFPDSAAYAAVGVTIRGNWVMISQTRQSSMVADGGDSGAPVFLYDSNTDFTNPWLLGIYHAGNCSGCSGNRYISGLANVANDLAGGYWNMFYY